MKDIYNSRFSKIGTNPMKYLNNFELNINHLPKGEKLTIKELKLLHKDVEIFSANSEATFRQNIDAWVWMGFAIRKNKNEIIKIIESMSGYELIEYIKMMILVKSDEDLVNVHRNTILIKLLALNNNEKKSFNKNYTYAEVMKECGKFEEVISKDKKYIELITKIWGDDNDSN